MARCRRSHSAGLDKSSREQVTPELLEWADLIFVMERAHRNKLAKKFRGYLKHQRVVCLNIPNEYPYMDPRLVRLFRESRSCRTLVYRRIDLRLMSNTTFGYSVSEKADLTTDGLGSRELPSVTECHGT